MKHSLILLVLVLLAGCGTQHVDVNENILRFGKNSCFILPGMAKSDYSLYCNNGDKAKLKAERRQLLKYENGIKVYWETENKQRLFGQKHDPYRIFRKCRPYIEKSSTEKMDFGQYQSFLKSNLKDIEGDNCAMPQKNLELAFDEDFIIAEKMGKKYMIVCLEPLVVIALDVENISWNSFFSYRGILYFRKTDGFFYRYDPLNEYRGRVVMSSNMTLIASGIIFPYGLDYGLELPYVTNPSWFSPDMKVKEQPVEMISETKGQIKVPWGYLYLTKQNDNWVVTAEKK